MTMIVGAVAVAALVTLFTLRSMSGPDGLLRGGGSMGLGEDSDAVEGFEKSKRLVVVHAKWCGHCTELLKESGVWQEVKEKLPGIDVQEIDEADGADAVKNLNVTSFPDIRVLDGDEPVAQFDGDRKVDDIVEFALKNIK